MHAKHTVSGSSALGAHGKSGMKSKRPELPGRPSWSWALEEPGMISRDYYALHSLAGNVSLPPQGSELLWSGVVCLSSHGNQSGGGHNRYHIGFSVWKKNLNLAPNSPLVVWRCWSEGLPKPDTVVPASAVPASVVPAHALPANVVLTAWKYQEETVWLGLCRQTDYMKSQHFI